MEGEVEGGEASERAEHPGPTVDPEELSTAEPNERATQGKERKERNGKKGCGGEDPNTRFSDQVESQYLLLKVTL